MENKIVKDARRLRCYRGGMVDPEKTRDERDATGAIPELADVVGAELLDDTKQHAQRVWCRVYGLPLIREQLPFIYARWETDEQRASTGGLALFINEWLRRTVPAAAPKSVAPGPRIRYRETHEACRHAFFEGKPLGCSVHTSGEVCEIEGRKN